LTAVVRGAAVRQWLVGDGILRNLRSGAKATGQPTGRLVRYRPQPYIDSSGKHTHDLV